MGTNGFRDDMGRRARLVITSTPLLVLLAACVNQGPISPAGGPEMDSYAARAHAYQLVADATAAMGLTTPESVQPADTGGCGGDGFPHAPGVTIDLVITAPAPPGDPTVYIRRAAAYLESVRFTSIQANIPTLLGSPPSELPEAAVSAAEPGTNFAVSIALIDAYHTIQFNVTSACVRPVGTDDPSSGYATGTPA